jgi:hypothetical protein
MEYQIYELEAMFELRQKADMRAVERWRKETGRDMVMPDHVDLVVWLMYKLDAVGVK